MGSIIILGDRPSRHRATVYGWARERNAALSRGIRAIATLGLTRIINFAHGSLFMLGAYAAFTAVGSNVSSWWGFVFMLAVSAVAVGAFGMAFEMIILRRIYRSPQAFQLLVTFSLVLICADGVRLLWGNSEHAVSEVPAQLEGYIRPFGVTFPVYRLFLIVTGIAVCLGMWAMLYRTCWGILVRAATVDRDMLRALGVDVGQLFTAVFALGAGLAGLAGGLAAPIVSIGPGLHGQVLTDAFVIVAIGGMGSFPGSFIGAILIGQANAFGILMFPQMAIVVPFALMTWFWCSARRDYSGGGSDYAWFITCARNCKFAVATGPGIGFLDLRVHSDYRLSLYAVSFNLLLGYGGMLAFGYATFFGLGAYAFGVLLVKLDAGVFISIVAAPFVAAAVGALIAYFCIRLSGIYFGMLTFAFQMLTYSIFLKSYDFAGGDDGLRGLVHSGRAWHTEGHLLFRARGCVVLCVSVVADRPLAVWRRAPCPAQQQAQESGNRHQCRPPQMERVCHQLFFRRHCGCILGDCQRKCFSRLA